MSRLFVALRPPAEVVTALAAACEPLAVDPPDGLRFVPSGQWHVTLQFLGAADAVAVAECLGAADLPGCVAELDGAASVMGRVVIFGVSGVEELAAAVRRATDGSGEPARHREFRGHITVGRIPRHASVPALRARLSEDHVELDGPKMLWRPENVELVCSSTEASGVVHEVLGSFAIGD